MATVEAIEERVVALERRVADWEGQMGFLVPLTRQLHREVLTTQAQVSALDQKVSALDQKVSGLDKKVDGGFAATLDQFQKMDVRLHNVESDIAGLKAGVDALPGVIAEIINRRE